MTGNSNAQIEAGDKARVLFSIGWQCLTNELMIVLAVVVKTILPSIIDGCYIWITSKKNADLIVISDNDFICASGGMENGCRDPEDITYPDIKSSEDLNAAISQVEFQEAQVSQIHPGYYVDLCLGIFIITLSVVSCALKYSGKYRKRTAKVCVFLLKVVFVVNVINYVIMFVHFWTRNDSAMFGTILFKSEFGFWPFFIIEFLFCTFTIGYMCIADSKIEEYPVHHDQNNDTQYQLGSGILFNRRFFSKKSRRDSVLPVVDL